MIFAKTNNVALNDICVFNINKREWEPLCMFGQMPCSRWSHITVPVSSNSRDKFGLLNEQNDTLFVFGGINLNSYCRSAIYTFKFGTYNELITTSSDKYHDEAVSQVNSAPNYLRKYIMKKVQEAQEEAARKNLTLLDGTALSRTHETLKQTINERCNKLRWQMEPLTRDVEIMEALVESLLWQMRQFSPLNQRHTCHKLAYYSIYQHTFIGQAMLADDTIKSLFTR